MKVRLAEHEDFKKVMDINRNVYDGNDYLPSNYHGFVNDSAAFIFVGEKEGNVICFIGYVMDGETEMVKIGVRLHPDNQGKGYMKAFKTITRGIMLAKFPSLQCIHSCASYNDYHESKIEKGRNECIETFHSIWWTMEQPQARRFYEDNLKCLETNPVIELNNDQAMELLDHQENLRLLFPTGYFIGYYNWLPRKVVKNNIRRLIMTHRILVTMESRTQIVAISFTAPNQLPAGNIYGINYYHVKKNADTFLSHLVYHVGYAAKTTLEESHVILHPRPQIDVDITEARGHIKPYLIADSIDDPQSITRALMSTELLSSHEL